MRKFRIVLILVTIFALLPARANALPDNFRTSTVVTVGRNTYRIWPDGDAGLVKARVSKGRTTIHAKFRYRGKTYKTRIIYEGALKGARTVTIRGSLRDGCESGTLWKKGVKVRVTNRGVYKWLHRTGADVTLI